MRTNSRWRVIFLASTAAVLTRPALGGPPIVNWTGAANTSWDTTSVDWLLSGLPSTYANGDGVIFQDVIPTNYNVSLVGTLTPGSILIDNDLLGGTTAYAAEGGDYTFGGGGNIGVVASGLTKTGGGMLTFANTTANGYTGPTAVYDGTLALDFSAAVSSNLISTSSGLQLGGATFSMLAAPAGASAQTFTGGTNILPGESEIVNNLNGGSNSTLNLGLISRVVGGTVDFNETAAPFPLGDIISTNPLVNGIVGGWATVNSTDWATVTGGVIVAFSGYVPNTWAPGANTTVTLPFAPPPASTTNSVQFGNNMPNVVTLAGLNKITTGGILVSSAVLGAPQVISGGQLTAGNSPDLIVIENSPSSPLLINSQIVNNGTSMIGLTKSGAGTLLLANMTNTYTGVTTINGGVLVANMLMPAGVPSSIGASTNAATNLVLDGGTLQYTGAGGVTDRLFTLGPQGGTIDASGTGPIAFLNPGLIVSEYTQAINGFACGDVVPE